MFCSRIGPLFLAGIAAGLMILVVVVAVGAAGPAITCTVPGDHATIQAAVDDLNCEVVDVAAGTFTENITIGSGRTVIIQGQGALSTTVDGADAGSVFAVQAGAVVTLTGLAVTNGSAVDGGGIINDDGIVVVQQSMVSNNLASGFGGGIYNNGGIVVIFDSTLSGNSSVVHLAGGGGIYNGQGTLMLHGSTLSSNSAGGNGAGIFNSGGSTLNVSNSTLSGNTSLRDGGGIHNESVARVNNSTLSGNSAGSQGIHGGGGIHNMGSLTVQGSTLSSNLAVILGGGIFNGYTLTLSDSTFTGNSAQRGGGLFNSGAVEFGNTILAGNTAALSGPDCRGTIYSVDFNLVKDMAYCIITGNTAHNIYGQDPVLGPLQDNGGPTWTQALLPGSPAIDAGNCPGRTEDQRGFLRPVDLPSVPNAADGCDMGAFEVQGGLCTVPLGYPTIQAAVDDLNCDVVDVAAGTFTENVTIGLSRTVTIQGQGALSTTVDGADLGCVFEVQAGAAVTLTGLTITGGDSAEGGGIRNSGSLTVISSSITGNWGGWGGGIYNDSAGSLTVNRSTLSGNSASMGGAIYDDFGRFEVVLSTLSGNSASHYGGGIYIMPGSLAVVRHSTVSGNWSGWGGGIYAYPPGGMTIGNSILADNTAGYADDCSGALLSEDYILVEDLTDCLLSGNVSHSIFFQDPQLGLLQDNGGPTWTQALLPGSPAIDTGNCPSQTADQRGLARPVDLPAAPNSADGCDMGSFELQNETIAGLAAVSDSPTVLGQATTFTATITAGTHVTYTWDFGDGAAGSGAVVSHTYGAAGPYTATVTAANLVSSATAETPVVVEEPAWTVYLPVVVLDTGASAPPAAVFRASVALILGGLFVSSMVTRRPR